jgi:TolB protein
MDMTHMITDTKKKRGSGARLCRRWGAVLAASVAAFAPIPALSKQRISIVKEASSKIPVVFLGVDQAPEISAVIHSDLAGCGNFSMLPVPAGQTAMGYLGAPMALRDSLYTNAWVVVGTASQAVSGQQTIQMRLYNAATGQLISQTKIEDFDTQKPRLSGHKLANAVYQRLLSHPGYFDTQIVYTAESGRATKKVQRIALMDQDGANVRFLTDPNVQSHGARACPNRPLIAYEELSGNNTDVVVHNVLSGEKKRPFSGKLAFGPRFTPDGSGLMLCVFQESQTAIYKYDLDSGQVSPMVNIPHALSVSPSFSPDGQKFVFASDHGGPQNKLYVATAGGGGLKKLSGKPGSYFAPVWSPDGQKIAFVRSWQGSYYLGIIDVATGNERMVARDHMIDAPSWAPNSQALVVACQAARFAPFSLYKICLSGHRASLHKVSTQVGQDRHGGNMPDWSPYRYTP